MVSCLKLINHTKISLIPKVENPETVNNFRPFSLCNVTYKIITKLIVNRLQPIIEKCISNNQGAFAPKRSIHDNILIAHEILSTFKRRKGRMGAIVIKLDLEKAYVMLNWDYIRLVLVEFGMNNHWIKLIMECITSTSSSVLINGKAHGYFYPSRGN